MELDLRGFGVDPSMIAALHAMMDSLVEEAEDTTSDVAERPHPPSRAYVRDTKAMRNTPADIIEYPGEYRFIVDMPGLSPEKVRVQLENGNTVVVSGERKREKEKHEREEGVKYLRMERRLGKMLKKFVLPDDSNTDSISAVYRDGELTVKVEKLPPPEPKKSRNIEVQVGGGGSTTSSSIEHKSAGSEQQPQQQQEEGAQSGGGVQTVQVT